MTMMVEFPFDPFVSSKDQEVYELMCNKLKKDLPVETPWYQPEEENEDEQHS